MSIFDDLAHWVENKPLVMLRGDETFMDSLRYSKHGFEMFTFAQPHSAAGGIKPPTLCLAEMRDGDCCKCYIGVTMAKKPITTFDSRVTVIKLREINISSFESLSGQMSNSRFQKAFQSRLSNDLVSILSPKLSSHIIEILAGDDENKYALENAAFHLPGLSRMHNFEWGQLNAIQTALAAFGLSKTAIPVVVAVRDSASSTLSYIGEGYNILEDNVIGKDSSIIPGFSLIEKDVTGRAVFDNYRGERLEVYTANRGPLEEMLGVDLIYVNSTLGNIIMIQYKMLEEGKSNDDGDHDWIFRPDKQAEAEIARMEIPEVTEKIDDYRLNRSPFYFKFVKRKDTDNSPKSFLISLEHLNHLLQSPKAKGPRGGIRMSYRALEGNYLRDCDIISLIRSGYIRVNSQ